MPYIPKNRITTDLYTSGGEFVIRSTHEPYTGFYHRYYDGQIFTGKNPNDAFTQALTVITTDTTAEDSNEVQTAYFGQDPDPIINIETWNPGDVRAYNFARFKDPNFRKVQQGIPEYVYTPTSDDYTLGEITRYFAKKSNELRYIEINSDTYNSLTTQDPDYAWQFYLAIKLPWQISGNKEEVGKVNRNMVLLTEQRNKIRGLQEFLRFDYLKFYKS